MKQKVIGLSGHIDHGKTALVKALTGVDTDNLVEEKKRGMTIDIGFAFLNEEMTLIDVPGHEKFVRNMMSGVSGIDLAILVVAADDGIMPQTKEHFEILNLLNIPAGIIVLNKIDLSNNELIELVELEIAELVNGSFLEKAPLIKVSAINNVGIDNLRKVIIDICNKLPIRQDRGIFRMHIDRVFSKKGYGTVVTGTVNSGSIKSGDTLEIIPRNIKTKIRSLQSHGLDVNEVALGDRAAINLQGVDKELVKRGSQLAEIGYLQSIKKMGVSINLLNSQKKVITQNQRIRVHLGTQEVMARVALIGRKLLNPGENTAALLRLETPLVAAKNDKFIIRSYSPIITIGGGEVIEVVIEDKWKIIKTKIQELFDKPNSDQLPKLIEHQGANLLSIEQLKFRLGISEQKIKSIVNNIDELIWKKYNQNMWLVTANQWSILIEKIILFVNKFHNKNPMEKGVVKEKIRQDLQADESVLEALLLDMENNKLIIREGKILSDPRFKLALNSEDDALQTNILKILDSEGFASSNLSELSNKINQPKEKIIQILKVAEKQGRILRIEGNLMFTKNNFIKLQKRIILHFKHKSTLSISEFKEISKTSRKYAVPLLEYFDKLKITYRDGNVRKIIK